MTDITLYTEATLSHIREIDAALLQADRGGDREAILMLLPLSEQFWAAVYLEASLRRAINDWRIAKHGIWQEAGAASIYAHFLAEAESDEHSQSVVTRLQNVQAVHFFYWEQGWALEQLRAAGISRLRQWVATCRKMVEEHGGIDPQFQEILCDPDVPGRHAYREWQARRRADADWEAAQVEDEEREEEEHTLPKQHPTVYGYANGGTIELVAWVPAGKGVVTMEMGYIINTPEIAELWQRVVEGEIKVKMR